MYTEHMFRILTILLLLALIFAGYFFYKEADQASIIVNEPEQVEEPSKDDPLPYGPVTISVGEKVEIGNVFLRVLSVEEESRCPIDVQCIQAGTVRVLVEVVSGMGTSTDTLALEGFVTTEAEKIAFIGAHPEPVSGAHIPNSAYQLTFEVTEREELLPLETPEPPILVKTCYVGGCSSQICSDSEGMASTCEYKEEYACYQTAVCEQQTSGECGWTPTPELNSCLSNSSF